MAERETITAIEKDMAAAIHSPNRIRVQIVADGVVISTELMQKDIRTWIHMSPQQLDALIANLTDARKNFP